MKLIHRFLRWLDELEQYHDPNWRIGPSTCPNCDTWPFPGGRCNTCGWQRPEEKKHKLISDNNVPAMIFVAVVWFVVLAMLFALFFSSSSTP